MSKTKFVMATPARYAEGVERELAWQNDALGIAADDTKMLQSVGEASAKAQLAIASAITANTEQLREIDESIVALVRLLGTHPTLSFSMGAQNELAERNERIAALEAEVAALRAPANAEPKGNDVKPN